MGCRVMVWCVTKRRECLAMGNEGVEREEEGGVSCRGDKLRRDRGNKGGLGWKKQKINYA